ncbi:MAG: tetratricopeptide repeat protein, partial [Proteiniphilum sp.]|nr:tetratricopeptide repeat protein [Proteiniphilum sp.]
MLNGTVPFFIIAVASLLLSCNQAKLSDARAQYAAGEYHAASRTYRDLYRNMPRDQHALRGVISYEMAENYRNLNQSARALTAYSNAIRLGYPDTMMYRHYAQMLHREGRYPQAVDAYRLFLQMRPGDVMAVNGIRGTELAQYWSHNPTRYVVQRMDLFNSRRAEFSPMLAHKDQVLYFTSSREDALGEAESPVTGMKYNDLFLTSKNSRGEWQNPKRIESEINTGFDEGTPSITRDGDYMFYTSSSVDPDHPTATEIYLSRRINGVWTAGRPLQIAGGDSISVFAHPAVSPSGRYLCFVSDMPGGYGEKDIWRAFITQTGEVLNAENLGPEINSPGNEMFPYMRNDTTIYFSSDGHPGMGGLDLFKATRSHDSDKWQIHNLQSPLNSSADDFGITFEQDRETGFLSSSRNDVRGHDHLYSFALNEIKTLVEGFVVDREDQFIPG